MTKVDDLKMQLGLAAHDNEESKSELESQALIPLTQVSCPHVQVPFPRRTLRNIGVANFARE